MDDFSGLEYDQESVCEEDVVSKTNNLLSQFNLPTQVSSVSDITASLFVVLYESLFSDRLPGIVRHPARKEEEISNCQMVIDVLSADVIKDNLSHIRGVDIVEGKVQAINNLLDIFMFLYEYVIKQIESDVPTDTDDDVRSFERLEAAAEDSETFLPASASQTDSHNRSLEGPNRDQLNNVKNGRKSTSPHDLDAEHRPGREGDGLAPVATARLKTTAVTAPSPIPPNVSSSLMGQQTLDSTADLIREGERLDRQFEQERNQSALVSAWEEPTSDHQPGPFDFIGLRPAPSLSCSVHSTTTTTTTASHLKSGLPSTTTSLRNTAKVDAFLESAVPVGGAAVSLDRFPSDAAAHVSRGSRQDGIDRGPQNLSATEPLPREYRRSRSPERMRATVGALPTRSHHDADEPSQRKDPVLKGLSSSYQDLHQMVQQTAALTRAAIDTSPLRRHPDRAAQLNITDLSQDRGQMPPADGMALARELNRGGLDYTGPHHPLSSGEPGQDLCRRGQKPAEERPSALSSDAELRSASSRKPAASGSGQIPPNTDYVKPLTREGPARGARPLSDPLPDSHSHARPKQRPTEKRDKPRAERQGRAPTGRQSARTEAEDLPAVLEQVRRPVDSAEVKERKSRLSSRLHEMGKDTLASAQRRLETEDKMFQHKQEFVKKLYEEEFDEAVDEVKGLLDKDRKLMKDMEEEYRRMMMLTTGNAPRKTKSTTGKPKGYLLPKTKKGKALRASRSAVSRTSSPETPQLPPRPLSVGEEEDLMPVLLEDFPHLYLSDQTWHELWRRGITQIENLTRAYEENKRRKSKAQVQLEEAARKHEVLANIVKKQLDHSQRMRQIKEQKRQQVMVTNKMHEKRTQSARARRYYNEYQVRARAKMLKRKNREELVFKNLFKDGLAIQKERIQEVRRYAKEQREKQAKKRQDEIDSLENFYRDQFEMLVEKLLKDKDDMAAREKAHQKVLEHMKRDLRTKMEHEIRDIQSQMFRDDDDMYLRQLEADRVRHELQHAKFQTRI